MAQRYFYIGCLVAVLCVNHVSAQPAQLSRTFRGLSLGMGLEELKEALQQDMLFSFRGDRDVSFLPFRDESLVETTGTSFVRQAFFQLRDGKVFVMAFTLNNQLVDHYGVFTSLVKKYGEPNELDPRQAFWESEGTRIIVERPLTVKYIDTQVFNELINNAQANSAGNIQIREEFLNDF
jgi:hypothetical protein